MKTRTRKAKRIIKRYTVKHLSHDKKKKETSILDSLKEARILTNQMRKQGRFITLFNAKGVELAM